MNEVVHIRRSSRPARFSKVRTAIVFSPSSGSRSLLGVLARISPEIRGVPDATPVHRIRHRAIERQIADNPSGMRYKARFRLSGHAGPGRARSGRIGSNNHVTQVHLVVPTRRSDVGRSSAAIGSCNRWREIMIPGGLHLTNPQRLSSATANGRVPRRTVSIERHRND